VNGWRLLVDDVTAGDGAAAAPGEGKAVSENRSANIVGRPLLCLSDIRGDLWALESVLAAVKGLDLCGIVVAGDHCVGGEQPFEVWTRLCSLGAHMACGPEDLALGALSAGVELAPTTAREEARLQTFLRTKKALGDVVCRRLADLPSTLVVSLDDTSGVMVMHGSPNDDAVGLRDDGSLADEVACVAEDVLVTGGTLPPFARRVPRVDDVVAPGGLDLAGCDVDPGDAAFWIPPTAKPLLVVNAGSVGMSLVRRNDGRRTAHAVLIAPGDDGRVHAWSRDILVMQKARARGVG